MAATFRSFISEKEIEEVNKKKQEEWERVRRPDQPVERPKEVYDNRTLYERLKQQKDKKQEEWEDQFKFKNMIYKGLDDEEAGFLTMVEKRRSEVEADIKRRETEEVSVFREAVAKLQEESVTPSTSDHLTSPTHTTTKTPMISSSPPSGALPEKANLKKAVASKLPQKSQLALIAGSIKTKRKRNASEGMDVVPEKKARLSTGEGGGEKAELGSEQRISGNAEQGGTHNSNVAESPGAGLSSVAAGGTLSGLVAYCSSTDSSDGEDQVTS